MRDPKDSLHGEPELLEDRYGERVYQSDYMAWIDPGNPYRSLLWYIDSAERIDFSLEGIPPGSPWAATWIRRRS